MKTLAGRHTIARRNRVTEFRKLHLPGSVRTLFRHARHAPRIEENVVEGGPFFYPAFLLPDIFATRPVFATQPVVLPGIFAWIGQRKESLRAKG